MSDETAVVADGSNAGNRRAEPSPTRGPAVTIAAGVRDGQLLPGRIAADAMLGFAAACRESNALGAVPTHQVMVEAARVARRVDLDMLPLAGVPVGVERTAPVEAGHSVVTRLQDAGAVIVGLAGASADNPFGRGAVACNPWNTARVAGGAAGAAVAAGLVPVACDGGDGEARVAAAHCGVFAIEPGRYRGVDASACATMVEAGVLATTVDDAALVLAALAVRQDLADVDPPGRLRIGVAVDPPSRLIRVDRHWRAAARRAASIAAVAGHAVGSTVLPHDDPTFAVLVRRLASGAHDCSAPSRSTRLARRAAQWVGDLVCPDQIDRVEAHLLEFFDRYDVLITPTVAAPPPPSRPRQLYRRSAKLLADMRSSPFIPLWNLVGWPTASVPMGVHPRSRTPVAAQLVGPPGSESTLLRLSAQMQAHRPWQRTVSRGSAAGVRR
ncbi:amidase family protein [Nocardia sp. CNY236]|uniref:amidase family protein n=1 Tax=Nocardia sp. CNY236 TaxID=1169152 RepID=UPI00048CDA2A|nr:amidase family protein [Nocardia sp. CNY236]